MTEPRAESIARLSRTPSWRTSLSALLRADAAVQMRNRRSLILSLAPSLVLLFGLFNLQRASVLGDPGVRVALCLTIGMVSIGVLGYSTAVARDRDGGVFQRLRVTPTPTWVIMCSRLAVQVAAILVMSLVVLVAASAFYRVAPDAVSLPLTLLIVMVSAAMFLSIGQAVVGLIRSADTLNAAGRFLYVPLIVSSLFGHTAILGSTIELISRWSPGGVVATLLSAAMNPSSWSGETWGALLACAAYIGLFAGIGIRWFRWTSQ